MSRNPHTAAGTKKALIAEGLDSAGGASRNRTDVHGFAIRCITTLPPRRNRLETEPKTGAGNETRTRDPNLGKVVLYQLSYSRLNFGVILRTLFLQSSFF